MIKYFKLEIIPEIHNYNESVSIWSICFQVKTHQNMHTFQQLVSIEQLQTNSILDLMFKMSEEKLKELIDKEKLEDK